METDQSRRIFLEQFVKIGLYCPVLLLWNKNLLAQDSTVNKDEAAGEVIDFKKYSYCGIQCESQCELFKATKGNNTELKKKVYEAWKMKEEFGIEFDPEKVSCYTCKPGDRPLKPGMKECTVRNCAIEKGAESCIQCGKLKSCDKEFWRTWPELYKHVIGLQKQYAIQRGAMLLK